MFDRLCQCPASPDLHAHDDAGALLPVGWAVTDPDGNVVQSGGVSIARADGRLAELIEQLSTEGEQ